jgi:hypothetical protein
MLVANAFVISDPPALLPRCPNVSIQDLHLNLMLVDVAYRADGDGTVEKI